ncbi:hypothetical protein, partial [Klebsiella pneumoniae]|uniref:hypothetical protein n=1 Tax=Klebsiella pneumoniae TaxID=573 RepID=UPI003F4EB867
MKNKLLSGCISCLVLISSLIPLPKAEASSITLVAPSAVLLDGRTKQVLYAKSPHTKRAPASTTKLLAVMVA